MAERLQRSGHPRNRNIEDIGKSENRTWNTYATKTFPAGRGLLNPVKPTAGLIGSPVCAHSSNVGIGFGIGFGFGIGIGSRLGDAWVTLGSRLGRAWVTLGSNGTSALFATRLKKGGVGAGDRDIR